MVNYTAINGYQIYRLLKAEQKVLVPYLKLNYPIPAQDQFDRLPYLPWCPDQFAIQWKNYRTSIYGTRIHGKPISYSLRILLLEFAHQEDGQSFSPLVFTPTGRRVRNHSVVGNSS